MTQIKVTEYHTITCQIGGTYMFATQMKVATTCFVYWSWIWRWLINKELLKVGGEGCLYAKELLKVVERDAYIKRGAGEYAKTRMVYSVLKKNKNLHAQSSQWLLGLMYILCRNYGLACWSISVLKLHTLLLAIRYACACNNLLNKICTMMCPVQ